MVDGVLQVFNGEYMSLNKNGLKAIISILNSFSFFCIFLFLLLFFISNFPEETVWFLMIALVAVYLKITYEEASKDS
jgi:Ca2+/Na+ antiporter